MCLPACQDENDIGFGNAVASLVNMRILARALRRTLLLPEFGFTHVRFDIIFDLEAWPRILTLTLIGLALTPNIDP